MPRKTYYDTLNLRKSASQRDIKSAYRKLAHKYHPDLNNGDKQSEEKFKELCEAYSVLSDEKKRKEYDQAGMRNIRNYNVKKDKNTTADGVPLDEIFENFFGGFYSKKKKKSTTNNVQGKDGNTINSKLTITLEDASLGNSVSMKIPKKKICTTCKGSGAKPGTKRDICGNCQGAGTIKIQKGVITIPKICGQCKGKGSVVVDPCLDCKGEMFVSVEREVVVNIPKGVKDKAKIRIRGEGEKGVNGGKSGDLVIDITIKSHQFFIREGKDIKCKIPIRFAQAALGDMVEIPTLDGKVKMKIPPGMDSGRVMRLKGKGIQSISNNDSGDQLVEISIEVPKSLSRKQKDLLRKFDAACEKDNYPSQSSVFEKIKKLLRNR